MGQSLSLQDGDVNHRGTEHRGLSLIKFREMIL